MSDQNRKKARLAVLLSCLLLLASAVTFFVFYLYTRYLPLYLMALAVFFGIESVRQIQFLFDWQTFVVLAAVIAIPVVWKRIQKKEFSAILLVVISGVLGMLFF